MIIKKKIVIQILSLLMVGSTIGCQTVASSSTQTHNITQKVVTNNTSQYEQTLPAYASESPAIDAQLALPDGTVQVNSVATGVTKPKASVDEIKSVWISYLEMQTLLTGKTGDQFRKNISGVFDNVKNFGLNTVIVQVRPFGDALYKSAYFPWSYIITGTEGKDPGFDPLEIMVQEAKSRGLKIEAWLNPYRIRASGNKNALSSNNQAKKWLDTNDDSVVFYNGVTSYNPASKKARELIVNGAREIVKNYDIDAIHIDDYFYPSTDAAFDKTAYTAYKNGGGNKLLADWRRANVETLIKSMYAAIKKENPDVLFGISPQSSVYNNYNAQYLDVQKILSSTGYCDYICPQIYFGFENQVQPFSQTLKAWSDMIKVDSIKLYVGIAAYKVGAPDSWAGNGKSEWVNNTDILARMVEESRRYDNCTGYVIYRYDSLFKPAVSVAAKVNSEAKNLKTVA